MSERQWKRIGVLKRVAAKQLTKKEAATILGLCPRQVQRLEQRFKEVGQAAVIHGSTGKLPNNRLAEGIRKQVLRLAQKRYAGFNDQHLTEKLVERESIEVSRSTVRRILRAAGLASPRRHRPAKHHRRRDRKRQTGLMILWDGSRHDWLEGRGPMLCLMGAVDDATGELLPGAHFVEQECAAGYLRILFAIAKEKGLPHATYQDRHGALQRNDSYWTLTEELRGERDRTHVGRALAALEIEPIVALSPQAKGRVERLWGTLQDRLTSELRLAKVKTGDGANALLEAFRPDYNKRFALPPQDTTPAWRLVRKATDLERLCSFYYEASVRNDNTVRLGGTVIDIPPGPRERSYAHAKVEVRQLLDGSWRVYYRDALLATAAGHPGELRALKRGKRSAATRAFRNAIATVAAALP